MKIWKDKEGNKLTAKEFMERFKAGVEGITPIQRMNTQITGTRISLLGIFLGICVATYGWKNLWWVGVILIGAFITTGIQYLGLIQQRNSLKKHEENCDEMSLDDLMLEDGEDDDWILRGLDKEEEKKAKEYQREYYRKNKLKEKGGK